MNLIDVTKTHHHYHSNNKVVVVTKRDGIQGPEGKNGISPHIDPNTLHWFVGDVDTGVFAGMSNTDDITLIHLFDTKSDFPSAGTTKDLYLDRETSTIYCWDAFRSEYRMFKANYITNLEEIVMNVQDYLNRIDNSTLKKPQILNSGALLLTDGYGNTSCTDITYQELLEKIDAKADVELPSNFTPGSLVVGSESGSIESSEIKKEELIAAIESTKNALKFVGEKKTDNLVLVDESGNVKSSTISNEELLDTIENAKTAVQYKNKIVPGSLVLSTEDGIESSNVTHDELLAVIESVKTSVKFEEETSPGFVVVSGDTGGIKNSLVTHSELIAAIKNSTNSVKYEGEVVPEAVVLSTSNGIKSSELNYSELTDAIEKAKTAAQYKKKIVPGSLVISTDDGLDDSGVSHEELIAAIESTKTSVKYDGDVVNDTFVLSSSGKNIKSSDITYSDVVDAIDKAKKAIRSNGEIIPGSLILGTEDGVIESSEIKKEELIAAIQSAKTAVQFNGEVIQDSLVLADASGNIKSSGKTYDQLIEDLKNSGIQSDWNEEDNTSPAFILNKPDFVLQTEHDALVETVKKKSGFASTPTSGNLIVSDSVGNLYSSSLNMNNIVTADSIVVGSFMDYVTIDEDGATTVTIPQTVMQYVNLDVYHNGKLIVPEIHYLWEADDYIDLVGFTANKDDIFSFIGHGVTSNITPYAVGSGTDHTHLNMDVLESITQEKVDSWDTVTTHNHDDLYIKKDDALTAENLPVATETSLGAVKSSSTINGITIAEDGTMSVSSLDISLLTSTDDKPLGGEDYDLILSSGSSYSYRV